MIEEEKINDFREYHTK